MARTTKGTIRGGSNVRKRRVKSEQQHPGQNNNAGKHVEYHKLSNNRTYDRGFVWIVLVTIIAYLPVFSAGYVWDDSFFTREPHVQTFHGIYDIWFNPRSMKEIHYWPMTYTTFWIEYQLLGGFNPVLSHTINLFLHISNAYLLRRVLGRIGLCPEAAWLASAVFALHPLNVDSVAWAIERKDVLSGFFYLISLLIHPSINVKGTTTPDSAKERAWNVSLVFFVLGMLSKSIVVSLPAVLLLLPWMIRGRIRVMEVRHAAAFFVAGILIAAFDVFLVRHRAPKHFGLSLVERVMIASRAVCFYGRKLAWPGEQTIIYPKWQLQQESATWIVCFMVPIMALLALFNLRHRLGRGPVTALLFFVGTLAPVLGLIDFGFMLYSFVADRFQYLAGIGPIACFAASFVHGLSIRPKGNGVQQLSSGAALVMMLLLGGLASLTFRQASVYHDPETFFLHIVSHNPAAKGATYNLANTIMDQGRLTEAADWFAKAVQVSDEDYDYRVRINHGIVLLKLGRYTECIKQLESALLLHPNNIKVLTLLANALSSLKRHDQAVIYLRRALAIDKSYAGGWSNLGNDLLQLGRFEEAIESYNTAIVLNTHDTNARLGLAFAFYNMGQIKEARNQYSQVLSYDPNNGAATAQLKQLESVRF